MQDKIKLSRHVHKFGHIVVVKLKVLQPEKMLDILKIPGNKVVHGNHMVTFFNKPVAKVRAKKTCSSRN
jgi:hypothetical protein